MIWKYYEEINIYRFYHKLSGEYEDSGRIAAALQP